MLETEQVYEGKRQLQLGLCFPLWYISLFPPVLCSLCSRAETQRKKEDKVQEGEGEKHRPWGLAYKL